jgi:ABC-2 type transport system permease protein
MVTPIRRGEIITGYMLGLGAFALLQAFIVVIAAVFALELDFYGNLGWVFLAVALLTIGAANLGILASTFARNEFQAVQFMPMIIVPQVLLSEAFFTLGGMPGWVQALSKIFPLTHAVAVVKQVMVAGRGIADASVWQGMLILVAFALAFLAAGAYSLRKKAL